MKRAASTKIELSGVSFPPGSDLYISEQLGIISSAADMRRTVNGELVNVARSAFRKRSLTLSGSDMRPAAMGHLFPGDYLEAIPAEPIAITLPTPSTSAQVPAGAVSVVGISESGDIILPSSQPADPRPLSTERDPSRISALRSFTPVNFPEPVRVVRYRPVLCCLVMDAGTNGTENQSSVSWSISLEEV